MRFRAQKCEQGKIGCSGWLIDFARSLLGLSVWLLGLTGCLLGMARWLLGILSGIY